MKKFLCAAAVMTAISLVGCGVVEQETTTQKMTTQETTKQKENVQETTTMENEESSVDLSGIQPDAAKEIQTTLDEVNANVSVNDKADAEAVIRQAVNLMALAAGNSLVEDQVQLVVEDWKQNHKAELSDFQKKMAVVYGEYEKLATGDTEAELKKAGLSLEGYEYCSNGKLDMVEWIYADIQS